MRSSQEREKLVEALMGALRSVEPPDRHQMGISVIERAVSERVVSALDRYLDAKAQEAAGSGRRDHPR